MPAMDLQFRLLQRQVLPGVASASGIATSNNRIYVVGDNTPWLFEIDKQFNVISRLRIIETGDGVIPKPDKPDFESLEAVGEGEASELILFGSGAKSPQRDIFIRIPHAHPAEPQTYSLTRFYDHLRGSAMLRNSELNIEAVAVEGDRLYLFNRRKNVAFVYSYRDFLSFVSGGKPYPEPKVYEITLPAIRGIEAGISGATSIKGTNKIIFTASVEDTPNAYDDGEILGSYVGIIDFEDAGEPLQPAAVLISESGEPLKLKVESVCIVGHSKPNEAEVLLVTDNDENNSEIIKGLLRWQ